MMLITFTKIVLVATLISAITVGITLTVIFFAGPLTDDDILCRSSVGPLILEAEYDNGDVNLNWTDSTYSSCSITYYLTIIVNDEIVMNNTNLADGTTYVYPNLGLCSTFHASIYGVSSYETVSDVVHKRIETEITEITSLSITNQLASWIVSSNSDACRYRVERDGAVIAESITTITYDFSTEVLEACISYELTVTPLHFDETVGTSKAENFDIGPPVITSPVPDGTILEWVSSSDSGNCEFSIELDGVEITRTKETSYNFDIINDLIPCKQYDLTITPIGINGNAGDQLTIPNFEVFAPINDLKIVDALITWTTPNIGECTFETKLNDEPENCCTVELEFDLSSFSLEVCATHDFSINVVSADNVDGPVHELPFELLPQISNPNLDDYQFSWDVSTSSDECQFQIVVNGEIDIITESTVDLSKYDLVLCTSYVITVTPIGPTNQNIGTPLTDTIEMFAKINNVKVENTQITWDFTTTLGECSFLLIFNDDEATSVPTKITSHDLSDMDKCKTHTGTIFVVNSLDNRGEQAEIEAFEILPEIEDIQFEAMVFSWTASDDSQECKFEVQVNDDDVIGVDSSRSYSDVDDLDLIFCVNHTFRVRTVSQSGVDTSAWQEREFELPIEKLEDFDVVTVDMDVIAKWSDRFEKCNVIIDVDDDEQLSEGGTSVTLQHNFVYCLSHKISARAENLDGERGEIAELDADFYKDISNGKAAEYLYIEDQGDVVELNLLDSTLNECEFLAVTDPYYDDISNLTLYCVDFRILITIYRDDGKQIANIALPFIRTLPDNFQAISRLEVSLDSDAVVTVTFETQNFDDCNLNYLGNCDLEKEISEATYEIDVEVIDGTTTLQFDTCPIAAAGGIFSMAIRPQYISADDPDVDIETIFCTYNIGDVGDGTYFMEYAPSGSSSDLCDNVV